LLRTPIREKASSRNEKMLISEQMNMMEISFKDRKGGSNEMSYASGEQTRDISQFLDKTTLPRPVIYSRESVLGSNTPSEAELRRAKSTNMGQPRLVNEPVSVEFYRHNSITPVQQRIIADSINSQNKFIRMRQHTSDVVGKKYRLPK
jgi:hypothetical protein